MNLLSAAKNLLADIATLKEPAAAAGLVGVVVELLPGVNINAQVATGIITGVAVAAGYIKHLLAASDTPPAVVVPTPVPTPAPAPPAPASDVKKDA